MKLNVSVRLHEWRSLLTVNNKGCDASVKHGIVCFSKLSITAPAPTLTPHYNSNHLCMELYLSLFSSTCVKM